MSMGLVTGPLLKIFGYRCVAIAGGLLFSIGIIATAFAVTFQHFLITYSIIAGLFKIFFDVFTIVLKIES